MYATGGVPPTDPSVLLATAAGVNLVLEPIYSSAVWGAGWYNAAMSAHYADAALRYEGTVDVEMQLGASGVIWDYLAKWIGSERAYPRSLDISPDGARVYQYRTSGAYAAKYDLYGAWNSTAGFSTSAGSFLTASLGVIALFRDEFDPTGVANNYSNYTYILQKKGVIASNCSVLSTTNPLNPGGANVNPIPFWRTNAQLLTGTWGGTIAAAPFGKSGFTLPQADTQTVEWSLDVAQGSIWLYVCSGSRLPVALLQGPMEATGNVVLYNPEGVFDPILGPNNTGTITSPYSYAENTIFQVDIADGAGGYVHLLIPAAVIESDEYGIAGLDAVTNRTFGIKGLGGRCVNSGGYTGSLPPAIISDHLGAYIAP